MFSDGKGAGKLSGEGKKEDTVHYNYHCLGCRERGWGNWKKKCISKMKYHKTRIKMDKLHL